MPLFTNPPEGDSELPKVSPSLSLPMRVIVSLRAGFVLALANIVCVVIFSWAWMHVRSPVKTISVTGSAKRTIESDLIVWRTKVSAESPSLSQSFENLKASMDKTVGYLKSQHINDNEITVSSITTIKHFVMDERDKPTDRISGFELVQTIEVSSSRVKEVAELARNITQLIKEGVMLDSEPPSYLYTKLADLKITMLAEATKDATVRARHVAENSNASLGSINEARMGVMQINPVHSSEVSSEGNNDTSSFEKDVMAVVSTKFDIK